MPKTADEFIATYDKMILHPEMRSLYDGTDFYNVGDWSRGAATLSQACRDLVERHFDGPPSHLNVARVLDVGCGLGSGTALIASHYSRAEVVGINISPQQVAHAETYHPEANYRVMDATCLEFPDASFDRIFSVEAAFHFNLRSEFMQEALRVLKPGGSLVLSDILFKTTEHVGQWFVPDGNFVPDIHAYRQLCFDHGYMIETLNDITEATWLGFCRYLRTVDGMLDFAAKLEETIQSYLIVRLVKPENSIRPDFH